ncbi:hypothetical protein ANO11243_056780 [Dothideomycetidae sp. 11243]|nr:hypothetical protein ANO11243_056780 [fungal sp. No.11243]
MSVTTSQNPITYSIQRTLADYDLHHSTPSSDDDVFDPSLNTHPQPASTIQAFGPQWETQYRRVPPHAPVNTGLDIASRSITLNNAERFFIFNMFNGILIVQALNRAWRATGGKLNTSYFRWPVGGEF